MVEPTLIVNRRTDENPYYERLNGRLVQRPLRGTFETHLRSELIRQLGPFVTRHGLGHLLGPILFRLDRSTGLERWADAAFVSQARWPSDRRLPSTPAWEVIPNLAIEILGLDDTVNETEERLDDYFRVGVREVWLVLTPSELVHVYTARTDVHILTRDQDLTSEALLPGFRMPLAELFPPPDA